MACTDNTWSQLIFQYVIIMQVTIVSLSFFSLCAGAEHLCQTIYEAVPSVFFDPVTTMITLLSSEVAVHILNHLFNKLSDVCLVQGGEVVNRYLVYFILSLISSNQLTNDIRFFMHVPGGPLPNVAIFICWHLITLSTEPWFLALWRNSWWSIWRGNTAIFLNLWS